jgi:hypothetical protein
MADADGALYDREANGRDVPDFEMWVAFFRHPTRPLVAVCLETTDNDDEDRALMEAAQRGIEVVLREGWGESDAVGVFRQWVLAGLWQEVDVAPA